MAWMSSLGRNPLERNCEQPRTEWHDNAYSEKVSWTRLEPTCEDVRRHPCHLTVTSAWTNDRSSDSQVDALIKPPSKESELRPSPQSGEGRWKVRAGRQSRFLRRQRIGS